MTRAKRAAESGSTPALLIVDDDASIALGLSAALECDGRRILVCRDVESAKLILEHERVDDVVMDMKLTGSFRFEGLDFLELARRIPRRRG